MLASDSGKTISELTAAQALKYCAGYPPFTLINHSPFSSNNPDLNMKIYRSHSGTISNQTYIYQQGKSSISFKTKRHVGVDGMIQTIVGMRSYRVSTVFLQLINLDPLDHPRILSTIKYFFDKQHYSGVDQGDQGMNSNFKSVLFSEEF